MRNALARATEAVAMQVHMTKKWNLHPVCTVCKRNDEVYIQNVRHEFDSDDGGDSCCVDFQCYRCSREVATVDFRPYQWFAYIGKNEEFDPTPRGLSLIQYKENDNGNAT